MQKSTILNFEQANENIPTYQTNIKRKHFFNSMVGNLQNSDHEYYSYRHMNQTSTLGWQEWVKEPLSNDQIIKEFLAWCSLPGTLEL